MQKLNKIMIVCLMIMLLAGCGQTAQPAKKQVESEQVESEQVESEQVESEQVESEQAESEQEQISLKSLPRDIDATQVEAIRGRDDVMILDVREDWEYDNGHIPGSTLIPLGQLPNRISELPTDKTIVIVCHSGARSHSAVGFLQKQGMSGSHNMLGGIVAWERAGYQIE